MCCPYRANLFLSYGFLGHCPRLNCVVPLAHSEPIHFAEAVWGCPQGGCDCDQLNSGECPEKPQLDVRNPLGYIVRMLKSFRHRGLEKYFLKGTKSGIQAKHAKRLRLILARLDASTSPQDMNLPGLRLHEPTGKRKATWSVTVSGNWRITFKFEGNDAIVVDYKDYH